MRSRGATGKYEAITRSDNAIIRTFIDYAGSSITQKLETLLAGGYILQRIDDSLTYDYLHSSEENLWSILSSVWLPDRSTPGRFAGNARRTDGADNPECGDWGDFRVYGYEMV